MKTMLKLFAVMVMFFLLIIPVWAQQTGQNSIIIRRYISPDRYWPPGKTIKLEKLDLNTANLDQLLALPEINEDLALKIMRRRPIQTLEDLYHLPYISIDRSKIIMKGISGYVKQPLKTEDSGDESFFLQQ